MYQEKITQKQGCSQVTTSMLKAVFSLATVIAVSLAAERNYKSCKGHNDPSFSSCLQEAANIYFANLDEDVEGIHHTWKPVKNSINNGPLNVELDYNITKFLNSTKSTKVTLKYDANTKKLSGTIKAPHVGYEAVCLVDGVFMNFRLLGAGTATFHVYDMEASFETHLHIKPGSGTTFEMEELMFKINKIRKAYINISEIRAENKVLETAFIQVAKNLADEVYKFAKEAWEDNLKSHYEDLTREFLKEILDDGLVKGD